MILSQTGKYKEGPRVHCGIRRLCLNQQSPYLCRKHKPCNGPSQVYGLQIRSRNTRANHEALSIHSCLPWSQQAKRWLCQGQQHDVRKGSHGQDFWNPVNDKVNHVHIYYNFDYLSFFFTQLDTLTTAGFICGRVMLSAGCTETANFDGISSIEDCLAQDTELPLGENDLL